MVRAGTLKQGDSGLTGVLAGVAGTVISAGAAIDLSGLDLDINSLTGSGTVTNSGAAHDLTLFGATNYAGVISGKYTEVDIFQTATLSGNETFTGTAVIEAGSLALSGLDAQTVDFNGGGTLVLTIPPHFTGKISDFGSGAVVDLRNITSGAGAVLGYDAATGVLTVSDGTHTDKLTFNGSYVAGNFVAASDGSGGADIGWQLPPPATAPAAGVHQFTSAMAGFAVSATGAQISTQAPHPAAAMLTAPAPHAV